MSGRRQHLLDLLERYSASSVERSDLDRMRELALHAREPFDRHAFDPGHFTASVFVLSPTGHEVMLILHRRIGLWLQPGGHVDPEDDTVVAAGLREVQEETGIAIDPVSVDSLFDVDIHDIPAARGEPGHQHFDLRFLARAPSMEFRADAEVADARWFRVEDIAALNTDESVRRMIRKVSAAASRADNSG